MNTRILLALLAAGIAAPVMAQETAPSTAVVVVHRTNPAPSIPGSFDRLSPGQQNIARSLFDAQVATRHGPAPLSLDQIATMRHGDGHTTGWGNVFKTMKADGLIQAKNLGQVVSASHHGTHHHHTTTVSHHGTHTTTVTDGRGRVVTTGGSGRSTTGHGRSGDDVGTTAHGASGTGQTTLASTAGTAGPGNSAAVSHGGHAGGRGLGGGKH